MFTRNIAIEDIDNYRKALYSQKLLTTGKMKYNPDRGSMKNNASCCIIELDNGISDFYRSLVNKRYGIELIKPNWDTHITLIKGEEANRSEIHPLWNKYESKEIEITYYPFPRYSGDTDQRYGSQSGRFWFLTIECDFINIMRNELGLDNIKTPHLTIGKNKDK